jgi:membrane associated rhomboid family serine protease
MLQDRPYMRSGYDDRRTSVLTWLLSSIVAVFLLQNVFTRWMGTGYWFETALGLSPAALASGHVWTLVTYGFLHSTSNLLQVLLYLITIYFFGAEVLSVVGSRRFVGLYLTALAVGGACWTAAHWRHPDLLLGASAGVSALVILYACFFPNREISTLLFFVLPVRIKPKHMAYVLVAWDLCGFVFYEILGAVSPFGAAHSAHLGGMATAWVYFRYVHNMDWSFTPGRADIEIPRWMKQRGPAKAARETPAYSVNIGDRGHLRAEVDRILDKINSEGFGSLSADEKRVLDEARDLISRR